MNNLEKTITLFVMLIIVYCAVDIIKFFQRPTETHSEQVKAPIVPAPWP